MINFSNNLYARLSAGLQRIAIQAENPLQRAEQSCREIEAVLEDLKQFTQGYTFPDAESEIAFFRDIKPRFLRELIYFTELFYLEAFQPVGGKDRQRAYLIQALDRVGAYFERNQWFYSYYRMNLRNLDHIFFMREGERAPYWPGSSPELDARFSTVHSYRLSKMQAYEMFRDHLQGLLNALDNGESSGEAKDNGPRLTWTESKAALIELAYALRSRGAVNFGQSDVKELINGLEHCFNIRLGNFYRVYQGMRIRKKSRTPFLDHLKESLELRMDEADEA